MSTITLERPAVEPLDELLTLADLSAYTQTPTSTLYSMRSDGRLTFGFRLGRNLLFRRSDVEAWIDELSGAAHD